jgi:sigma-B regulation protein RsbU (phosphoserine phosphatase)
MTAPGATILVIDDTQANIALLRALLRGAGYQVVAAASGREGLAAAERESPDLILLDIMMPDLTGFEVCERLRAADRTRRTPIVFLTALHELEDHVKGIDVGGDDVLTKPINKLELLTRVRSLLRLRRLTEEVERQRRIIRDLLATHVSAEAAERYAADPDALPMPDRP